MIGIVVTDKNKCFLMTRLKIDDNVAVNAAAYFKRFICTHHFIFQTSLSQAILTAIQPRQEKTGFLHMRNKDADQLRGNREADQRLFFRYTDSAIPLLSKSEISSLWRSCVAVQPGLCRTWSDTPKTGFLRMRLIYFRSKSTFISYLHHKKPQWSSG